MTTPGCIVVMLARAQQRSSDVEWRLQAACRGFMHVRCSAAALKGAARIPATVIAATNVVKLRRITRIDGAHVVPSRNPAEMGLARAAGEIDCGNSRTEREPSLFRVGLRILVELLFALHRTEVVGLTLVFA